MYKCINNARNSAECEGYMKLEVRNITKSFGDKQVLHGISFEVLSGRALGLLGRNGAGKTTTIRILMDVFHANSGELYLDGEKFNQRKHLIGYLPEERGLYPKKKVIDQMVYLGRIRGISKSEAVANSKKWLKRLEISEYENAKLETLSKGNQQKVQLASTLVCNPEIVILDEPFSGLDPVNSRILQDVVKELISDNKLVIFSSHQMSYVEEFCEDIVIINKGDVVLAGDLEKIKRKFGENQLVISAVNYNLDELEQLLRNTLSDIIEITGKTRNELIVRNIGNVTREELLTRIMSQNIDIEHFETYKPSLNDIFVSQVGEETEEKDAQKEGAKA